MDGYYRKFINGFADVARPITRLTRKDAKFEWSKDCQIAFEYFKNSLTKEPILKYPDPSEVCIIHRCLGSSSRCYTHTRVMALL